MDAHHRPRTDTIPELPSLRPGLRLVEATASSDGSTATTHDTSVDVVQTLVLDRLLLHDGRVEWVDVDGHATTTRFARLAPSERLLERVRVARAFTPYQHATLVDRLAGRVDDTTTLVVCPALDAPYRGDDCPGERGRALLLQALARLAAIARDHDVPVLVTRRADDAFAEPIATAAAERITYTATEYGPRFEGERFETLVYPVGHGQVQTTLAFWQQVIAERRPLYEQAGRPAGATVG